MRLFVMIMAFVLIGTGVGAMIGGCSVRIGPERRPHYGYDLRDPVIIVKPRPHHHGHKR